MPTFTTTLMLKIRLCKSFVCLHIELDLNMLHHSDQVNAMCIHICPIFSQNCCLNGNLVSLINFYLRSKLLYHISREYGSKLTTCTWLLSRMFCNHRKQFNCTCCIWFLHWLYWLANHHIILIAEIFWINEESLPTSHRIMIFISMKIILSVLGFSICYFIAT